jgi:hypothetical protein
MKRIGNKQAGRKKLQDVKAASHFPSSPIPFPPSSSTQPCLSSLHPSKNLPSEEFKKTTTKIQQVENAVDLDRETLNFNELVHLIYARPLTAAPLLVKQQYKGKLQFLTQK